MAESIKVVDPNSGAGYDYASLFDWEAAQQANIDTSNTIAVAKCRCTGGTADTTNVVIDGWTPSATDYIKIWTDTSETYRHNGTWQTGNKYRRTHGSTRNIDIKENYTVVDGIEFNKTSAGSDDATIHVNASVVSITNCIFKGSGESQAGSYSSAVQQEYNGTGTCVIRNCIIYDWVGKSDSKVAAIWCYNGTWAVYNCTLVDCYIGLGLTNGTLNSINCGLSSCTSATNTWGGTINQTTNSTTTPTFVDSGADDFHLDAADTTWIGAATNLYNDATYPFQTDIDGQDRGGSAAAWDIGADEYVSAATAPTITLTETLVFAEALD